MKASYKNIYLGLKKIIRDNENWKYLEATLSN